MIRWVSCWLWVLLAVPAWADAPQRVISLDSCADQYLLALAADEQITGLSPRATWLDSFYQDRAAAFPAVRPTLEAVMKHKPDLVVAMWADRGLLDRLRRFGVPVHQIQFPATFAEITAETRNMGQALGQVDTARDVIAQMHVNLTAGKARTGTVMYLTPGGVTTGPGTLPAEIIQHAGFELAVSQPGYHTIPLEQLVSSPPQQVIAAYFDGQPQWRWSQHRVMRDLLGRTPTQTLDPKLVGCPAWFASLAVKQLRGGAP